MSGLAGWRWCRRGRRGRGGLEKRFRMSFLECLIIFKTEIRMFMVNKDIPYQADPYWVQEKFKVWPTQAQCASKATQKIATSCFILKSMKSELRQSWISSRKIGQATEECVAQKSIEEQIACKHEGSTHLYANRAVCASNPINQSVCADDLLCAYP